MKYSRYFAGLALAALGLAAIVPAASAGAAKDSYKGDIYITGFSPYSEVIATYNGIPTTKKYTASECGFVKISLNAIPSPVSFDGGAVPSLASIPPYELVDLPKCTNGQPVGTLPAGGILRYKPNPDADWPLMFTGKTPFTQYEAAWPQGKERKVKSNACGYIRLSNSGAYENAPGVIRVNATDYDTASMASVSAPPACKNNTLLLPAGFP